MPISREKKALYPKDWKAISKRIRFDRAGNRCECSGQCGEHADRRCNAPNGEVVHRRRGEPWILLLGGPFECRGTRWMPPVKIVLTVAHHPDPNPSNCADDNLLAACQRCHLLIDRHEHAANAKATLSAKREAAARDAGQGALPIGGGR